MDEEGKILSMQVPLNVWAKELIHTTIQEHLETCPVRLRVDRLELRFVALVAYMAGAGILGGGVVGLILKVSGA